MSAAEVDSKATSPKAEPAHYTKKQKMSVPESPESEWPEAWLMPDEVKEQCQDNKLEPNVPVSAKQLRKLGISYWKMDADAYKYPTKGKECHYVESSLLLIWTALSC